MKIVIISDSYKGTFSSLEVAGYLEKGIKSVCPEAGIIKIPVSDGGEGFLDALAFSAPVEKRDCPSWDSLMRPCPGFFLKWNDTGVIEMAQTAGLAQLKDEERNPLKTTTFGVGIQIKKAWEAGFKKFIIGLGGSATHDCGIGALQALGGRLYDKSGKLVPDGAGGKDLENVSGMDVFSVPKDLLHCSFILAGDVKNTLLGEKGAARVFAKQKGASAEETDRLEKGIESFCTVLEHFSGRNIRSVQGNGAAGGLGAGISALLNSEMKKGIEIVLDANGFDLLLRSGIDCVITGEGRADTQTAQGKVPAGIAGRCKGLGIPVFLVCGTVEAEGKAVLEQDVTVVYPLFQKNISLYEAVQQTPGRLEQMGQTIFERIKESKNAG